MYTKLAAAAMVLIAGIGLGSFFPKDESHVPDQPSSPAGVALRRAESSAASGSSSSGRTRSAASMSAVDPAGNREAPWNEPLASTHGDTTATFHEPPPLPPQYAALAADDPGGLASSDPQPARIADARRRDRPQRRVVHRVVDGDTLAKLALDYLGDATLGHVIAEANGGNLSDPLLVGVELDIPPRPRQEPSPPAARRPSGAQTRLVPVQPAQVMADTEPLSGAR